MNRARPADAKAGAPPPAPAGPPACSDAERRVARRLAAALRAAGRPTRTETLWVRPAWAAVLAACAAAGVVGSVLSVDRPAAGLVVAGAAFVLALAELTPWPVLRRLTFARATQNVLSEPAPGPPPEPRVTLVVVAPVDGPRGGVAQRARLPVRAITTVALGLLCACVAARVALEASGTLVGAIQLVPTAVLVLAVGALADAAVAPPAPAPGGDPPADVAVAAARMLAGVPLRHVAVEVVLAGAWPLGFRAWLRRDRRRPEEVALAFVASAAAPRYATAHPALRAVAEDARLAERRGRAPRAGRRPAIAVGGSEREAAAFLVALAAGLDAALARGPAQPASSERLAKSAK
jgi:hypothetical protein